MSGGRSDLAKFAADANSSLRTHPTLRSSSSGILSSDPISGDGDERK
jgi:hypothetical protein